MRSDSERLDNLFEFWKNTAFGLNWPYVFTLPVWLKAWWAVFGENRRTDIRTVWDGQELLGIAPLQKNGRKASFIGNADVCDYLDFIVLPHRAASFFHGFLDDLVSSGIDVLELRCLRPESHGISCFLPVLEERSIAFDQKPDGVSLEMELPAAWDDYLAGLTSKQRHEVRRKLRRLYESGDIRFIVYDKPEDIAGNRDDFLKLFRRSRMDKSDFMTMKMESFFKTVMSATVDAGLLKMAMLYVNQVKAAALLFFDYNERIYLYNSGYDPECGSISVGLLSKILLIRHGISEKKRVFDFLRGDEAYKYRLGGCETSLSRITVHLK
ncbi:MAG: GNAT family N-acetyltransferase [Desulfobacterales bacterium]